MSESAHLADALTGFLLEEENGWFAPVVTALEGLTAPQAAQVPAERFNSVWSIVRHMTHWMEFLLLRLRGLDPAALGEDWSAIPRPESEDDWAADKARLAVVTNELSELVRSWEDSYLDEIYREGQPNRYQVIQGIIGHNCYHTNEIISVRHMLGYWLERT